jgi:hypothetical protein
MENGTQTTEPEAQTEAPVVEGEQTETPAAPVVEAFDPAKIDPKVREYFEKETSTKYQDYEPSKKAAQELNAIKNDPEFQKWIMSRNAPPPPKEFEIDDERFTAALTDKAQFVKLVKEAAQHLHEQTVAPRFAEQEYRVQVEAKTTELNQTVQKFPDFKDLDKRGLIAPIIQKYPAVGKVGSPDYRPGITFEEAYWIAKQATYKEDVAKAARGQVTERKGATVERGNNAPSKTRTVTKVADRAELMERVAEDVRAGREPGEYDYD